jgi:hypothetical protein
VTTELNLDYGEARRAIGTMVAEVTRRGKGTRSRQPVPMQPRKDTEVTFR